MSESIENEYLNGFSQNLRIPSFSISDANKNLKVNSVGSDIEWSAEAIQTGYIANQGDGTTNTIVSSVGYSFNGDLTTGLFDYSGVLALRKLGIAVLQIQNTKTNLYNRLELLNDTSLTTNRISFGNNQDCGITGDASTSLNHKISIRSDGNERLRISSNTTENIKFFRPINIDSNLSFGSYQPQIYSGTYGSSNVCGISFDVPYSRINFQSNISTICQMNNQRIDFNEPIVCNQAYAPKCLIVDGTSVTLDTNLSNPPIIYMKRNLTADSSITINGVSSTLNDASPKWSVLTDGNGNASTFNCNVIVGTLPIVFLNSGSRSYLTTGTISLTMNSNYEFFYVPSDNRMVLVKT